MALKNLRATVTYQFKKPGDTKPASGTQVFYVPATHLLAKLDAECYDTAGAGSDDEGPHTITYGTATSWALAAKRMNSKKAQRFRIGGQMVRKSPVGYYMTVSGIETKGVNERGGPSYNEFRELLKACGSDIEVAKTISKVLAAPDTPIADNQRAIAALMGAMFLSEPKRNKRALPINLMLVDFVTKGIGYGSQGKAFKWDGVLWRNDYDTVDKKKSYVFEGGSAALESHERGGKLPMSNTGASEQSDQPIPKTPPDGNAFHLPNAEMDKEASILVRWLMHYLNGRYGNKWIEGEVSTGGGWGQPKVVSEQYRYQLAFEGVGAGGQNYLTAGKGRYDGIVIKVVEDAIKVRFTKVGGGLLL
jgi:hypothetical protein